MTMSPCQDGFKHIVAVEVAKDHLIVHILPEDRQVSIANSAKAIGALLKAQKRSNARQDLGPLLVVCEATGGYERHVLEASAALGLACHRAHGSRVRCFARYLGLAKTDPIDARMLARYGLQSQALRLYQPPSPQEAALKELKGRRDQIQAMLIAESNRLDKVRHKTVLASLTAHVAALRKTLAAFEAEIAALLRSHDAFARKARLMRSLKGVGPITAATLLADMPELGRLSKGEAARLTGLAPINQDSGKSRGRRHIEAGRAGIRRCLYMAAIVAMQCNAVIKVFAARLKMRGKPARVVIAAVMRKIIVILNGILKTGKPWNGAQTA
jgi:transposase